MQDRLLVSLFFLVFVLWGTISVMNPTIAFRYQFGGSRNRNKTPEKHELIYFKIIGYFFIIGGVLLIIATMLGYLTN
jgi:TRAP-type C4-dicarboxylate transport system permease small subunit